MSVCTRFAPSPTGFLHIGGVRTALFCWLFARQNGGRFILRIDDTDTQRNVQEAIEPILRGLRWLGIDWDEGPEVGGPNGPYFQSQRQHLYQQAVEQLLQRGAAYRDYARPEEIQQEREQAMREGRPFVYSRRWMAETPEQAARFEAEGRTAVVRLKMPREGKLVINDIIRGQVEFDWSQEQDHVIQRADGTCLYHLASVVDDYLMGVTHVIRAEEHLSNTPRQVFILQALGYPQPVYAHLPYVAEPGSKTKLSKRKLQQYLKNRDFAQLMHIGQQVADRLGLETTPELFNPVIVDFYEKVGFLPDALVNYLALLGWSLDDHTEFFERQQLLQHFSLERVRPSPASFDPAKLLAIQQQHMNRLSIDEKCKLTAPYLIKAGYLSDPPRDDQLARLRQVVAAAGDRIKLASDILNFRDFFTADEQLEYERKDFEKRILKPDGAVELLQKFRDLLAQQTSFDKDSLEQLMHQFIERENIKVGQIIHALRVAVTGKAVGFGMFETLEILGRDSCLRRIDRAIQLARQEMSKQQ